MKVRHKDKLLRRLLKAPKDLLVIKRLKAPKTIQALDSPHSCLRELVDTVLSLMASYIFVVTNSEINLELS